MPPRPTIRAAAAAALSCALLVATAPARAEPSPEQAQIETLKSEIFALADSFLGQGDPDFSRQRQLDALVGELLSANPQPPVRERLDMLEGAWLQIWGPYDYRSDGARGVDPSTDPERIYQVVFREGFYYNVAPRDVRDTDPDRDIVLLKGVYRLSDADPNMLDVRFREFTKTIAGDDADALWRLAARAADDTLEKQTTIVPRILVRLFFGGGGLREVYTDETMRITYGASDLDDRSEEFIYIMRRVD